MPRPKRDYGIALRDDIARLDERIVTLAEERGRKQRMLEAYETEIKVDLRNILGDGAPTRRRRGRPPRK
jgi:hypothetical protein